MADIQKLQIDDMMHLLNSSPYGKVFSRRMYSTLRAKNDIVFSKLGKVNLFVFLASMLDTRHNKVVSEATITKDEDYEKVKEYARKRNADRSASGRDIGSIPEVQGKNRKEECRYDLKLFLLTYFREESFPYEFGEPHLLAITLLQKIILHGGLHALAMPRGSGKTTIGELATVWAISYGHRRYCVFIGATVNGGRKSLDSIKTTIETNEKYLQDFPEIAFPVRALEGINIRAHGQTCCGQRTQISWSPDEIILPTVEGAETSGVILECTGIEGQIRGRKHVTQDGKQVRPDFFLCDDFQTDESAMSIDQCRKRLAVINKAIIGLAGIGRAISGFIPCTVIQQGDGADQLLDREKYPEFQGMKTKMMLTFPKNLELWEEYNTERIRGLKSDLGLTLANKFYTENRKALEDGCNVYWHDRYNRSTKNADGKEVEGEICAIQSAMNLFLTNEESFYSEYQNEPKSLIASLDVMLPAELCKKINRVPQKVVPVGCTKVVTYIDVQKKALYYVTCAFEENFTGHVIDYGVFPEQKKAYFTLSEIKNSLERAYPNTGLEGYLRRGLDDLLEILAPYEYRSQSGGVLKHANIMIDANWGLSTDTVYELCRQSAYSNILIPSHGKYCGASTIPFSEHKKQKGDKIGNNWRIPVTKGRRAIPYVLIDTNYWKSFTHARINTSMGDHGYLALFGEKPKEHELFADQICKSEFVVETSGRGRVVNEWKANLNFKENHYFDCLTGCHVLASYNGISLGDIAFKQIKRTRKAVTLSDMVSEKKAQIPQKNRENTGFSTKIAKKTLTLSEIQQKNKNS